MDDSGNHPTLVFTSAWFVRICKFGTLSKPYPPSLQSERQESPAGLRWRQASTADNTRSKWFCKELFYSCSFNFTWMSWCTKRCFLSLTVLRCRPRGWKQNGPLWVTMSSSLLWTGLPPLSIAAHTQLPRCFNCSWLKYFAKCALKHK